MTDRAPEWQFILCGGCCDAAEALAQEIGAVSSGRAVLIASCLSVCKSPATLAAQGEGRATYVFAGIGPGDVADIAAFERAYDAAPHGWIADARPLGGLRFKLVTRVPAATDPQLEPPA